MILYLLVLDFFFSCFFLNNSCKKNYFLTRSLTHLHYCKKNPLSSPTPHFICSALLTLSVITTHEVSVSGHFMPCYSCGHINEEVRFCIFSGQNETNSLGYKPGLGIRHNLQKSLVFYLHFVSQRKLKVLAVKKKIRL